MRYLIAILALPFIFIGVIAAFIYTSIGSGFNFGMKYLEKLPQQKR